MEDEEEFKKLHETKYWEYASLFSIKIKNRILQKLEHIEALKNKLNIKLKNKAYLKNAPKEIVQNDKNMLNDLIIEDNKLRSIVSSIK